MIGEELFQVQPLSFIPVIFLTNVFGDFSAGNRLDQSRGALDQLAVGAGQMGSESMAHERETQEKCEISFHYVRSPQISEKQSMVLQESNYGVDEVGQQDREGEHDEDFPSDIHGCKHSRKQECCQQDVESAAIWEGHGVPSFCDTRRQRDACTPNRYGSKLASRLRAMPSFFIRK